jgi:MFS transporter, ACS family, glucarate transporter
MGTPPLVRSGSKPSHVRFVVLGFMCTLALLTYLDRVCIMRVQKSMKDELRLDDLQMGWVFSAFLIGYALFEIPGGWMGDLWGARRVLGRIVLWWSAFTALTGCVWHFTTPQSYRELAFISPLLSTFGVLVLVRFLFGAGEAGAFPNINRVTRTWFPTRERGSAQGAVWMFARLGGAVAPAITGTLADTLGWRQAFWALGGLGAAWSAIFLVWFRDRPEDVPACNAAERERINEGQIPGLMPARTAITDSIEPAALHAVAVDELPVAEHAWPPMGLLLTSVSALATCVAAFCVCFPFSFYITWQPTYYEDVFGLTSRESEILTGVPFICGAFGALVGGWFSDRLVRSTGSRRWGRAIVGMAGFGGAGLCILAACLATTARQATALLCLGFFINDLAIPTIWAALADIGGRFVGTLSGLSNMVGNIGGAISPVLIPVMLQRLNHLPVVDRWHLVFVGMALVWFVAAASWLFIDAGTPLAEDS